MIVVGAGATLLLGGARSGKSDLAQRLAQRWHGPVVVVATATAGDDDMAARIARHRADRPKTWAVVEAPIAGAGDIEAIAERALVVFDCITMLVANLVLREVDDDAVVEQVAALARAASARPSPVLIVSNEVGLGVHPETSLGRRYRDVLGRANRAIAAEVDRSLFVAAGRAVELDQVDASW